MEELYAAFPTLQTVASYAGPVRALQKSISELCSLHAAGLNRAYLGFESGNNQILKQETALAVSCFFVPCLS